MTKQDHYEGPDFYIVQAQDRDGAWWTEADADYMDNAAGSDIKQAASFLWAVAQNEPHDIRVLLIQSDGSVKVVTEAITEVAVSRFFERGGSHPNCLSMYGADDVWYDCERECREDDEHERAYGRGY